MLSDLRELRKQRNLTLTDLSRLSGVASTTISNTERRKTIPKIDTVCFLGKALNLQPDELFKRLICGESFNSKRITL